MEANDLPRTQTSKQCRSPLGVSGQRKGRPMWDILIIALLATQISEAKTKDDPVVDAKPKELTSLRAEPASTAKEYFPPSESEGGWRTLSDPDSIRREAGMDPAKLSKLREWLRQSDHRQFAAVVIRRGHLVMQEERGKSAVTDTGRIASCSKAICATVLAIASEESQKGHTPRKMTFDDRAFEFIPWAQPLSDPRKARITVKQLLNHTSGICPEATGAPIDGKWDFILGHTDDARTASLAFDPPEPVVVTRHFVGRRGRCFAGMDLMISRPFALAG